MAILWKQSPKAEIVYICQIIIVYVIIITSIVNLSLNNGNPELWISLLRSAIRYALPSSSLNHGRTPPVSSSDLSKDRFLSNQPGDFTVELPHSYELEGQWMCGLKEIQISLREDIVYVCSDMCGDPYADNTMLPVLRAFQKHKGKSVLTYFHFDDPMYVKIKSTVLNRIRIFIRGSQLHHPNITSPIVRCTLHLKRWT